MAIIIDSNSPPSIEETVLGIKQSITNLYVQTIARHGDLFNSIWNNPNYTPAQIAQALGTDASAMFGLSSSIQNLLTSIDQTYVKVPPPSNYTVTVNKDGTVTVSNAVQVLPQGGVAP